MRHFTEIAAQDLIEPSRSRLWLHVDAPESRFAVLPAPPEDEKDPEALKRELQALEHVPVALRAGLAHREGRGEEATEKWCFLLPELQRREAAALARMYRQETILWKEGDKLTVLAVSAGQGSGEAESTFRLEGRTSPVNRALVATAFSELLQTEAEREEQMLAFVAEERMKGFPTAYIYQQAEGESRREWVRVL